MTSVFNEVTLINVLKSPVKNNLLFSAITVAPVGPVTLVGETISSCT